MPGLGAIGFAAPWMLLALVSLPVLWWLLRITPPSPRPQVFPPLRLLLGLIPKEETPAHTPLWLLLLRLAIAALVMLALARPILNPEARPAAGGPMVLVVDDGWSAAGDWSARIEAMLAVVDQAEQQGRPMMLIGTAAPANGEPLRPSRLMPASEARSLVQGWRPKPWAPDRLATAQSLGDTRFSAAGDVVWVSDGIDERADDSRAYTLAERLQGFGTLQIVTAAAGAKALLPPLLDGATMKLRAIRLNSGLAEQVFIVASAEQGRVLAREPLLFQPDATMAEAPLNLPLELRNRLTRIDIEGANSAGATVLLDERWRRRPVGLVSGAGQDKEQQPLLSDLYYLDRALSPFSEVRQGSIADLLKRELAVLVLSDIGQMGDAEKRLLEPWLERGGVLVRFAGPRLAENTDSLTPVTVRTGGGRQLGGAMSWSQPATLAPFPETSPYFGLAIPDDVSVRQQVLAEPDVNLSAKTWARLNDGTPLVTAEKRGQGWLVLYHTSANTSWSNLAISGLFVDLLRRTVDLAQGIAGAEGAEALRPLATLDGFGRLGTPSPAAQPVPASDVLSTILGPRHPPGFYGQEDARRALNITASLTELRPVARWPDGATQSQMGQGRASDLMPWLLVVAIALGLADLLIAFYLRGLLRRPRTAAGSVAALVLGLLLLLPDATQAQTAAVRSPEDFAIQSASEMRLAYVITGNAETDNMSRAGMVGLTDILSRRTSVEAATPFGVDLEKDEIAFFPFLYWPMVPSQPELSARAMQRVSNFMKTGGLILLDTRDQGMVGFGGGRVGPGTQKLRQILGKLDVPPLTPVPQDHVLTKAFYLMQSFPGRYESGQVWVERSQGNTNDGVTSLVIGGNDWASAWAIDGQGRPMAALVPGTPTQREMAYRFGVNVIMYTLTGNYKADQVHVPALLERLGQ